MGALRDVLRIGRRIGRTIFCEEVFKRIEYRVPTIRLGTEYGGWSLCPHLLCQESIVYSIGIGDDISFDLSLIKKFGITVNAFDPTPESVKWVRA
jgi:hypothetical protein